MFIADTFQITADFDNTSLTPGDIGYNPMYLLKVPAGVTFDNASFLGTAVSKSLIGACATVGGCAYPVPDLYDATGNASTVNVLEGETLYVLRFPLGSFTDDQPAQRMILNFTLGSPPAANLGVDRVVKLTPFFSLGATPALEPGDESIVGTEDTVTVTPSVIRHTKTITAPETETATGPNYTRTVTLTVDVATGETVSNLVVTDTLDAGMQFVAVTNNGGCTPDTSGVTPGPGGNLSFDCGGPIIGGPGVDKTITYTFYVPAILNATSGASQTLTNSSEAGADYSTYPRQTAADSASITARSIAIQKAASVVGGGAPTPTKTLAYMLSGQVSDYFEFNSVTVHDTLGDGQTFSLATAPTWTVTSNGVTTSGSFTLGTNYTVAAKDGLGRTVLTFDLSAAMGGFGLISGDNIDGDFSDGPSTFTITLQSTVDAAYVVDPTNTPQLTVGDSVGNSVTTQGTVNFPGGGTPSDGSATTLIIGPPLTVEKSLYAYNGNTDLSGFSRVIPGDTVTYQLRVPLSFTSYEHMKVTDFLPVPFLDADEMTNGPASSGPTAAVPPAGQWYRGFTDTLSGTNDDGINPAVTVSLAKDSTQNTLTWNFGTYEAQTGANVIEILFTITATNEPMADDLNLANLSILEYDNSNGPSVGSSVAELLPTGEPALEIEKVITSISNVSASCGAFPSTACSNVDAGDQVSYQITIENTGNAPAYNIKLTDDAASAANFNGAVSVPVVSVTVDPAGSEANLFTLGGLTLLNSLAPGRTVTITYTGTVPQTRSPGPPIVNTATIIKYASTNGGPNYATNPADYRAQDTVNLRGIRLITKAITGSSIVAATNPPGTTGGNINQGETLTFSITATLSGGTYYNFALTDAYAGAIPPVTCGSGGFTCSANVSVAGTTVTVTGTDAANTGTIAYTYTTSPLTASGSNTATVSADDYNSTPLTPVTSTTVNWALDQPDWYIDKTSMLPLLQGGGNTVNITLTWRNTDTTNPMYQCVITDILPTGLFDWTTAAPAVVSTPAGYTFGYNSGTGAVTYTQDDLNAPLPSGAAAVNVTATFSAMIRTDVFTGSTYTNTVSASGKTLPDSIDNPSSATRTASDTLNYTVPGSVAASKALTDTSQLDTVTAGTNVAVGETFTYDLTFNLSAGTTRSVILSDVMTAGYNGVTLAGATLARSDVNLNCDPLNNPGNINAAPAGTPVDVLTDMVSCPASALPSCPAANMFTLTLGDAANTSGGNAAYTLSITLRVSNVAANTINRALSDVARIYYNNSSGAQFFSSSTPAQTVNVQLPVVGITKSAAPSPQNAGSTVTYTLTVSNTAAATAPGFDWTFRDLLPATLTNPNVTNIDYNGSSATAITASFTGITLNGTIDRLDPNQSIIITYTADILATTLFRSTITNGANAQTTTLPGGVANERTGPSGGANPPNNLTANATAPVITTRPTLTDKAIVPGPGQPPYAIGDVVHYQLVIDVPVSNPAVDANGTMTIRDTLPAGLTFLNAAPYAPSKTLGGGVVNNVNYNRLTSAFASPIITFGIDRIHANAAGTITIDYYARVLNVVGNQLIPVTNLTNSATATFTGASGGALAAGGPFSETITVGEPVADMTKSVISGATAAIPGSIVRWQFTVENTGDKTAWQTDISDPLPAGLYHISGVTVSATGDVRNSASLAVSDLDAVITPAPDNTKIAFNDLSFPPGASLTVEFDSVVMNTITPGRLLNNIVTATFASQPTGVSGLGSEVRDGADGLGGPLNDYYQSTNQTFGFRLYRNAMKFENPTCTACDPSCPTGAGFFVRVVDDGDAVADNELDLTTQGTIEAWIQATSCRASDVDAGIVIKGTANACYGFGLSGGSLFDDGSGSDDAQNIGFRLGPNVLVAKDHLIQPGKWYHVACVWDANHMYIYINGILEATRNGTTSVPVNDEDLILGQQTITGGPFQYYGNIDEFRLWSVARDVDDIRDNMCRTLPLNPPAPYPVPGLAVYLQSDEDNGDIQDISGNGNDGVFSDASRTCSAAPLGDDSKHDYVGGGGFTKTITGSLAGPESIKVEEDGGFWGSGPADKSGLQVYWTEIPPEPASGPFAWKPLTERGYYGVFVTGGTAPTYKVTYTYAPAGIGNEDNLDLLTRSENCMPWRTSNATPNPGANTIEKTLQSGTEYILGVPMDPRNAILFGGTDDYVSVADAGAGPLRLTTDGTMEAWIYITNYQIDAGIVGKGDTTDGYSLYTDNTTGDQILFSLYIGGALKTVTSNATLNANTWYHIAATWDDADVMHLYINGVLDNSSAAAGTSGDTTGNDLTIGLWNGTYFEGLIDEVRVWDTARAQGEIRNAMCRKIISTEPEITNLVGYWRFDEETDSATCGDSSGNNRVGTMNTTLPAPGFSDIRDSRRCSSAPIGDGSAYAYHDPAPGPALTPVTAQLSHPKGDYMVAMENAGGPAWSDPYSGLHIYRIDAPPVYPPDLWDTALYPYTTPNGMTPPEGPPAWSSIDYYRYWGIFVTDWDDTHAPAYDADYHYEFNPSVPYGADVSIPDSPQIGLAKRPDYCFGTWSDSGANWDSVNLQLQLSGEEQFGTLGTPPTNPEYVLGGINKPLAITLASFAATIADGCIVVSWETATEIDTAGFYLWRSDQKDGVYTRIDGSFTRSEAKVETSGASYRFKDCEVNAKAGTYYYKLEEVDMDNTNDNPLYGPITPVVQPVAASETPKNESGKSDGGGSGCFIGVMSGMMSDE